jgi:aminoglycoside phosphotransferase (APT) family kinase protein
MEDSARRTRPDFLYEPRREIHAYRRILPHAPPGTATCYGVIASRHPRAYRLLLERVDGLELRHVGALAIWEQTAAWIAQFHRVWLATDRAAATALAALARRSRLLVYDEAFYWQWVERAVQFSARGSDTSRIVERIARGYAPIVDRLTRMPRTVIHGELYPCNVLVQTTRDQVRICPIDWEMAALGPALMDLASLTTGWDQQAQQALLRAYGREATESPAPPDQQRYDLDCCRMHLALRMLGWSHAWAPPPQHAHDWLAEASRLAEALQI